MSFLGPRIVKLNGGLGQTAPSDRNVGALLVANGYETASALFGEVHELHSLDDAEALGFSVATDANAVATAMSMTWYHISEYFRLNPDGVLYLVSGDDTLSAGGPFAAGGLADLAMAASDNGIRYMGVVFGAANDASITSDGGLADFVKATRTAAQAWVEARAAEFVYVDTVVLEGFGGTGALADLKTEDAPQVHVTVACDHGYMTPVGEPKLLATAAVGTVLGSIGVRMLSESIGSVTLEKYPDNKRGASNYTLVDTRKNRWVKPGTSLGDLFADLTQVQRDELRNKAYGYAGQYEGYQGVYFDHDATCTTVIDDFNTIHTNRLWNEAARRVRRALIPRINSRVQIDPASGKIKASAVADWDAACKRELNTLLAETEIADFRFSMDPNQDVIAQGKVLVKVSITPNGIAKAIEAEIGFTNPNA